MISPEQCPGYQGCAAPLCFVDKSLAQACWYPGEPVCKLRQVPKWIKIQRRITKVLGIRKDADNGQERYGAFTVKMLEAVRRMTPQIRGIDTETEAELAWLNKRHVSDVSGVITDITKDLASPGPSSAPSAPKQTITEGQVVMI